MRTTTHSLEPGASLLVLLSLAACGAACSDPPRNDVKEAELACPGALEGEAVRCIKACGLAVETDRTYGITFVRRSSAGGSERIFDPNVLYTSSFCINGGKLSLDLPVGVLSDLRAGRQGPPICIGLSLPGGSDGLGQYMPGGSSFSTDQTHHGMVALTAYDAPSGIVEGIFAFDAALQSGGGGGGGGAGAGSTAAVTHIEQGWFRAPRQAQP